MKAKTNLLLNAFMASLIFICFACQKDLPQPLTVANIELSPTEQFSIDNLNHESVFDAEKEKGLTPYLRPFRFDVLTRRCIQPPSPDSCTSVRVVFIKQYDELSTDYCNYDIAWYMNEQIVGDSPQMPCVYGYYIYVKVKRKADGLTIGKFVKLE